jgi:choice-of-anchor A domain-containing protein
VRVRHVLSIVLMVGAVPVVQGAELASATRQATLVNEAACSANRLTANDDGSTSAVPIGFPINFYGTTRQRLWVNNNGNVTLDAPLATYTPFPLADVRREIIAPFFGDVDTRGVGSDVVKYGYGSVVYEGHPAFCATWKNVGYYAAHANRLNTFQLLLVDRHDRASGDFDIVFNYDKIQWESGDASGGVNGLGGTPARAGFSNGTGDPGTSYEVPGSGLAGAFLDTSTHGLIVRSVGSTLPGRQEFAVTAGVPSLPFVYVALGDSYSSGEGVPEFENGGNYPFSSPQENTLTLGGDGCHRSLANYAKLNNGRFVPDVPALLVDRTCSGAVIKAQPGDAHVGIAGNGSTQVDEAEARLQQGYGLSGTDVDLVTLSAGGNDAGFSKIIAACLAPTVLSQVFETYDKTPAEIEWFADRFGSCERFDNGTGPWDWGAIGHSDDAIAALGATELEAHADLKQSFPNADVLHLTYPSILPAAADFGGDTCGGILRLDADYARGRITRINDQIRAAVTSSGATVVDLEGAFGENALCPANPSTALAHGIPDERLKKVVDTLLGAGSPILPEVDNVVHYYEELRSCVVMTMVIMSIFCKPAETDLMSSVSRLKLKFETSFDPKALAGMLAPGETDAERQENFTFLFHPNARGHQVMACHVSNTWKHLHAAGSVDDNCAPFSMDVLRYEWNGTPLTNMSPIRVVPGQRIPVSFNGFDVVSSARITYRSQPIDGGTVLTGPDGRLETTLTIPTELDPGVHTVQFAGTNGGSPRTIEVLIEIDGQPSGGDPYSMYLPGFKPGETVRVSYLGLDWTEATANKDGGVLVEIPLSATTPQVTVTASGAESGATQSRVVEPVPAPTPDNLAWLISALQSQRELRPGAELASRLDSVIADLTKAATALAAVSPDRRAAARAIEHAVISLTDAQAAGLFDVAEMGEGFVKWALAVERMVARDALGAAVGGEQDKLAQATEHLPSGDALVDAANYSAAAKSYRQAVSDAADSAWWVLTKFNIATDLNLSLTNPSIGGQVVTGGDASLKSWTIGSELVASNVRVDLMVGGSVTGTNGQAQNGSITYTVNASGPTAKTWTPNGTITQRPPTLDVHAAFAALRQSTGAVGALPANGSVATSNNQKTTLRLDGTDAQMNTFDISAAQLQNATTVDIKVPAGSNAIVRVSGSTYSAATGGPTTIRLWRNGAFQQLSSDQTDPVSRELRSRLVWIFPTATTLSLGPVSPWDGTLIAPNAAVTLQGTTKVNGGLIASSVSGGGAIRNGLLTPRLELT